QRLGKLLRQRRPLIDPRYRVRRVFAADNHLTDKTVQEVENAYRSTFSDQMLTAIEVAYRLPPGTITEVLANPDIDRLPDLDSVTVGPIDTRTSPQADVDLPPEVALDVLPEWERHVWLTPGLTTEERRMALLLVRLARDELHDVPALIDLKAPVAEIITREPRGRNHGRVSTSHRLLPRSSVITPVGPRENAAAQPATTNSPLRSGPPTPTYETLISHGDLWHTTA